MKIETLKKLIDVEFDRCSTISEFKSEVFRLLDFYDEENSHKISEDYYTLIPYHQLCGCNPKNGGSGVCGCGIGNIQVKSSFKKEIYESVQKEQQKFKI